MLGCQHPIAVASKLKQKQSLGFWMWSGRASVPPCRHRSWRSAWSVVAILMVSACADSAPASHTAAAEPVPWQQPVSVANCGPSDVLEMGLQGQVTIPERLLGFQGTRCNLELVGQWPGEGANLQHAWFDDCAFYGQATVFINENLPDRPTLQRPGTVVINASDPARPIATEYLNSAAMIDPWESLKVNPRRKLLAAVNGRGNAGGPEFDVYDVSVDCKRPTLLASVSMEDTSLLGHEGNWMPDGMTYIGSDVTNRTWYAVDVSDPRAPRQIAKFNPPVGGGSVHGVSFSDDGNRGYFVTTNVIQDPTPDSPATNGFYIFDTSELQQRKPDPKLKLISQALWKDGSQAQHTIPIFIHGRAFLVIVDEWGSAGPGGTATWALACAQDLPPFGFARIYDISDEKNPTLVSKLMLETHDPANCSDVIGDNTEIGFGYDSHYCSVDNEAEATILACGYFSSGLRVFDIRDPFRPREVAYYNPPAKPGYQAGSGFNSTGLCGTVDWTPSMPRIRVDRGEIWFTSNCNGFQIVRFTNGVFPLSNSASAPSQPRDANGQFGGSLKLALLLPLLGVALRRRKKGRRTTTVLAFCGFAVAASSGCGDSHLGQVGRQAPTTDVFEGPVLKAACGAGSQPETDIQGRVSIEDRESGRSLKGYRCNLELIGQYQGQGTSWVSQSYRDCAYHAQRFSSSVTTPTAGVHVVDVRDPANPVLATRLTSPAFLGNTWETLKVNETRALLAGVLVGPYSGPAFFDIYDIGSDCRAPILLNSIAETQLSLPANTLGHEGGWSPDGKTYWSTGFIGGLITAIDVSDPSKPRVLFTGSTGIANHGFALSEDGNRLYIADPGSNNTGANEIPNGMAIFDVSEVQSRALLPRIHRIGELHWTDGLTGQHAIPVSWSGKPHVIFVDEMGAGGARIIDISDETAPVAISKLKLAIQMPESQALRGMDIASNAVFGYEAHYCSVDRDINPTALACGYFQSGVRVFDIRDPRQPKEIAYYNPPAQLEKASQLTGSEHANAGEDMRTDWCSSPPRFVGSDQLWVTCQDNGFMALRFTNSAYPISP